MNTRSALPATQRVVEITTPGKPEVLQVRSRALPQPGRGEVLIEVAAAGVNRPDIQQRLGKYPVPPGASDLPGLDVAGTVAQLGEGVTQWNVGDKVCALTPGGGYAEYCIAPASSCLPVPNGLDLVQAASLPETYFTVLSNVFDRGALQPRETFMVQGGSVDFYAGVVYYPNGIPADMFVPIFAVGRVPGWTVQALEQMESNILIRPLTLHSGPEPRPYVSIDAR